MRKQEELFHQLTEMIKETKEKKLHWSVQIQTTEYNDPKDKPVEEEDGIPWVVDECYVAYSCQYKGKEFCMITYEMIKNAKGRVQTTNMVFLPPPSVRVFQLHILLPHAVETSNILANQVHTLYELLLAMYKEDKNSVTLDANPGTLVIE